MSRIASPVEISRWRTIVHHLSLALAATVMLLILVACGSRSSSVPTPTRIEALPSPAATAPAPSAAVNAPTRSPDARFTPLAKTLDKNQQIAETVVLNNPELQRLSFDPVHNTVLRTEVFGVYPARESDLTSESQACLATTCYRVDLYNWATNTTYSVLVDVVDQRVVNVDSMVNVSPELPPHLVRKAMQIAVDAPEVKEALGFQPDPDSPTMAGVKTALNNTVCERTHHLCVAPTFELEDKALWAIVDLTDDKLVGVRWTQYGDFSGGLPTEETIERQDIFDRFCKQSTELARNGWRLDYMLTASDGLRISDLNFAGKPVLRSAKLVDYHVSYSTVDGFGYSDAIGCPMFSSAAVVAMDPPVIAPLEQDGEEVGFFIEQDFVHPLWPYPCNYRYKQRYEFFDDGRFRVMAANLGRGCGNDATYRFLLRIDPVAPDGGGQTFAQWDGETWQPWPVEQWHKQGVDTIYTPEGYLYRLTNQDESGYYIEPSQGQFDDGGRGDNAFTYVVKHHPDEGDADMLTLGSCCNTDYRQGPEQFISDPPEDIENTDLVIWYVPVIENDDTPGQEYCWADRVVEDGMYVDKIWPCWSGPMFVPIK